MKDLASGARTFAGGLDNAATAIEAMKYAALVHLGVLAGKAGISMALIPVTGGLSMLIGGAAIAVAQQAIRRIIKECMEEVVGYIVSALTEPAGRTVPRPHVGGQLGESFFGCQDLLWAAYVAGAVRVDGPAVQKSAVWSEERNASR